MKNNFTVTIHTKTDKRYKFTDVDKIDYNFLNGTLIRLGMRGSNGKRNFRIFPKENVEDIDLIVNKTSDSGNNTPYYTTNNQPYSANTSNNEETDFEEDYNENDSDDNV